MNLPSFCVTNTDLPSGPPKVRLVGTFPRRGTSRTSAVSGVLSGARMAMVPFKGRATKILPSRFGAQAVEFERIEFFHEAGRGELGPVEPIGPHLAGVGFADVECCAVRAQINAVSRSHRSLARHHLAASLSVATPHNAPDLAGVRKARIAGKECAVARDSQVVRLVKTIGMKIDLRRRLTGFNHKHVVLPEVGDIHPPFPIEANAVANAAASKRRKRFRPRRARTQFSDRILPLEIHDIQGAGGVARSSD